MMCLRRELSIIVDDLDIPISSLRSNTPQLRQRLSSLANGDLDSIAQILRPH